MAPPPVNITIKDDCPVLLGFKLEPGTGSVRIRAYKKVALTKNEFGQGVTFAPSGSFDWEILMTAAQFAALLAFGAPPFPETFTFASPAEYAGTMSPVEPAPPLII